MPIAKVMIESKIAKEDNVSRVHVPLKNDISYVSKTQEPSNFENFFFFTMMENTINQNDKKEALN